jgi:hypothetical protein
MARTIAKGPRGDSRRALELDRVSEALINSKRTPPRIATQTLHQLDHAIALHLGRMCIGFVLEVDRAAIALHQDSIEIGKYESCRLAFAAVSESYIGEVDAP